MMASDPDVAIALLTALAVWSLRSMALGGIVAAVLAIARVKRVGTQLTLWTIVLIAALAMPALTRVLPTIRWAVPIPSAVQTGSLGTPGHALLNSDGSEDARAAASSTRGDLGRALRTPMHSALTGERAQSSVATSEGSRLWGVVATGWPVLVGALYGLVVAVLFARLLVGARATRRLLRTATSIDDVDAHERLRRHAGALGLARTPALAAADALVVPITTGIVNPTLVLPATWREWTATTTDAVFRHELAHVARRDALIQRLSLIHRALCWFSPFSWWLSARLSQLAEHASDEAVLASGIERETYSEILVGFVSAIQPKNGLADWQIAMARRAGAEQRIARILDWPGETRRMATSVMVVAALLFAAAAGLVAAVRPIATTVTAPAIAPSTAASGSTVAVTPSRPDERGKTGGASAAAGLRPRASARVPASTRLLPASPEPPNQTASSPRDALAGHRLTVLLFELTALQTSSPAFVRPSTLPAEMRNAIDAAVKWTSEEMAPTHLVAVLSIGTRLDVHADFTSDPATIREALSVVASAVQSAATAGGASIEPSPASDVRLRALKTLCMTLAPIQQKKTVLYFGNGVQTPSDTAALLREVVQTCNSANAAITPVDVRGLPPAAASSPSEIQAVVQAQSTAQRPVFTATRQTVLVDVGVRDANGAFVPDLKPEDFQVFEDGIEQRIGSAIQRTSNVMSTAGGALPAPEPVSYYVLGYSPNTVVEGPPFRYRRLRLSVSHPGVKMVYVRDGYYPRQPFPDRPPSAPVAGGGATSPIPVSMQTPYYTQDAMLRRLQGQVELEALVLEDGSVGEVRVTKRSSRDSINRLCKPRSSGDSVQQCATASLARCL